MRGIAISFAITARLCRGEPPNDGAQLRLILLDALKGGEDHLPDLAAVEGSQFGIIAQPHLEQAAEAAQVPVDAKHLVDLVTVHDGTGCRHAWSKYSGGAKGFATLA